MTKKNKTKDSNELSADRLHLAATTRFPSPVVSLEKQGSDETKIAALEEKFRDVLEILGLDLTNDSIAKTPRRLAKMYVEEIFSGLNPKNFPEITLLGNPSEEGESSMIVVKDISLVSFCEHHFVPMAGLAHVAYIPKNKVIGLSKINRIVRYFSQRPQLQERLTAQIADSLCTVLNTEDVAVAISAQHFCVTARGVRDEDSTASTHILRGRFKSDPSIQRQFFDSIK